MDEWTPETLPISLWVEDRSDGREPGMHEDEESWEGTQYAVVVDQHEYGPVPDDERLRDADGSERWARIGVVRVRTLRLGANRYYPVGDCRCLVAQASGVPAQPGSAVVTRSGDVLATIALIELAPAWRARGLGRRILAAALQAAAPTAMGVGLAVVPVAPREVGSNDEEAFRKVDGFYRSLGFEGCGTESCRVADAEALRTTLASEAPIEVITRPF